MLIITNERTLEFNLSLRGQAEPVAVSSHLDLVRRLLASSDEALLVSPFLQDSFFDFFDGVTTQAPRVELITSLPRGEDQLVQPSRMKYFGEAVEECTGHWPTIGIDRRLHSKIYIFSAEGSPFAGIVTSANLTRSGLKKNHETGVLLFDRAILEDLAAQARSGLDFVGLSRQQLGQLCGAADAAAKNDRIDVTEDVGLGRILELYCTPSEGNRDIALRASAKYYIKVSGVSDRPILPADRWSFDEPQRILNFAKSPSKIELGDCLLDVAVGGMCFLSYYSCASAVRERSAEERRQHADYERWPFYVYGNNLSLHYGKQWFHRPIMYDEVVRRFKESQPSISVTKAGKDHFLPAMQMGHSWVAVTQEFGEFARRAIDRWKP